MGGDYTRFTFDPFKAFSGKWKQQGRVSLDSDFNEFEEILDRRQRAQMLDTLGRTDRAVVPLTTPAGFQIGVAGPQLTIGVGRAYVHGILAECFGDVRAGQPLDRDDVLGGVKGRNALPYELQPFAYSGMPKLQVRGTNVVYLDVWQREVTVFEDDRLREPALNGPDTATRIQTAWQVKVAPRLATTRNCADTPPGWTELTAPSTARLTARADGVLKPPPGPCEIHPAGGFTGLENRLFRIEVHSTGTLGGAPRAQFKWSHDNASLAARVVGVKKDGNQWTLKLSSTGPDTYKRFDHDDHIELLDDDVEFAMRDKGVGGRMMKVVSADHANQVLVVDADLTGYQLHADRNPRIRRWDYAGVEPLLRDVVANTVLRIGTEGVSITFDGSAADAVHAGDFWVFEARTADGSIGKVVNAPPRGPLHHFARLALVSPGQTPSDCRVFWPPTITGGGTGDSCCSVVVKPGQDIQAAIDKLAGTGGCVCLKMGVHTIPAPLLIRYNNLTLHAEAPWVTVRLADGGPLMLRVESANRVSVLGIRFEAQGGARGGPMVSLEDVRDVRVADCSFGFIDAWEQAWNTIGIRMESCHDCAIEDNVLGPFSTGIKGQESDRVRICGNHLLGGNVPQGDGRWSVGAMGIVFTDIEGIAVEQNLLTDFRRGIAIGDLAATTVPLDLGRTMVGCRIAQNVVTRTGGIASDNVNNLGALTFGIHARMQRCDIVENAVRLDSRSDGGILAHCGNVLVARNLLSSTAAFANNAPATIIPRGVVATVRSNDALACVVRENLFTGLQQAILVSGTDDSQGIARRVDVVANHIVGHPDLFKALAAALGGPTTSPLMLLQRLEPLTAILVTDVRFGRVADNEISIAVCGIACDQVSGTSIAGNTIDRALCGVAGFLGDECDVADNVVRDAYLGLVTAGTRQNALQRNVFRENGVAIFDFYSDGVRIQDNDVSGGGLGIEVFYTADGTVRGNRIVDTSGAGIFAFAPQNQITVADNHAARCGYKANGAPTDTAVGIGLLAIDASVNIESCHVTAVGESSSTTDPVFQGQRFGIVVRAANARVRVHGCTITSPSIAENKNKNPASRALLITGGLTQSTGSMVAPESFELTRSARNVVVEKTKDDAASADYADAADNLAEQTASPVVEIILEGEIIFSANRCHRLDPEPVKLPVVRLVGNCQSVTGNRVRGQSGGSPSMQLVANRALAVVGNVATTGADTPGVAPIPAPYAQFNATT